jgi:hypothetical protein
MNKKGVILAINIDVKECLTEALLNQSIQMDLWIIAEDYPKEILQYIKNSNCS